MDDLPEDLNNGSCKLVENGMNERFLAGIEHCYGDTKALSGPSIVLFGRTLSTSTAPLQNADAIFNLLRIAVRNLNIATSCWSNAAPVADFQEQMNVLRADILFFFKYLTWWLTRAAESDFPISSKALLPLAENLRCFLTVVGPISCIRSVVKDAPVCSAGDLRSQYVHILFDIWRFALLLTALLHKHWTEVDCQLVPLQRSATKRLRIERSFHDHIRWLVFYDVAIYLYKSAENKSRRTLYPCGCVQKLVHTLVAVVENFDKRSFLEWVCPMNSLDSLFYTIIYQMPYLKRCFGLPEFEIEVSSLATLYLRLFHDIRLVFELRNPQKALSETVGDRILYTMANDSELDMRSTWRSGSFLDQCFVLYYDLLQSGWSFSTLTPTILFAFFSSRLGIIPVEEMAPTDRLMKLTHCKELYERIVGLVFSNGAVPLGKVSPFERCIVLMATMCGRFDDDRMWRKLKGRVRTKFASSRLENMGPEELYNFGYLLICLAEAEDLSWTFSAFMEVVHFVVVGSCRKESIYVVWLILCIFILVHKKKGVSLNILRELLRENYKCMILKLKASPSYVHRKQWTFVMLNCIILLCGSLKEIGESTASGTPIIPYEEIQVALAGADEFAHLSSYDCLALKSFFRPWRTR
uniref:MMS22L_N domain-containing protein n=1 Tax=Trichuris muris TaxID=70415 RepID=A0A5S6QCI0_TRIMR